MRIHNLRAHKTAKAARDSGCKTRRRSADSFTTVTGFRSPLAASDSSNFDITSAARHHRIVARTDQGCSQKASPGGTLSRSGSLCAEAGTEASAPFPGPLSPSLRSGQVFLAKGEHFPAQSRCQRRYAPMVFGIIPECRRLPKLVTDRSEIPIAVNSFEKVGPPKFSKCDFRSVSVLGSQTSLFEPSLLVG
jgi:hypothetical protein